jgi:hypothetical protein
VICQGKAPCEYPMTKIDEAFASKSRTIQSIVAAIQEYIQENWQRVWEEGREELLQMHQSKGDFAYAMYAQKLFQAVRERLTQHGLSSVPAFPGILPQSIEKWGPANERERCFWSVVSDEQGVSGSIVLRFFHDHTNLRLPEVPRVLALEAGEQEVIARFIENELTHLPVEAI